VVETGSVAQLFADRIEGRRDLRIRIFGHVSASRDLRILAKTVPAVLLRTGR
jgi:hypothetical protein